MFKKKYVVILGVAICAILAIGIAYSSHQSEYEIKKAEEICRKTEALDAGSKEGESKDAEKIEQQILALEREKEQQSMLHLKEVRSIIEPFMQKQDFEPEFFDRDTKTFLADKRTAVFTINLMKAYEDEQAKEDEALSSSEIDKLIIHYVYHLNPCDFTENKEVKEFIEHYTGKNNTGSDLE